jgi:dienelactone hydrolase
MTIENAALLPSPDIRGFGIVIAIETIAPHSSADHLGTVILLHGRDGPDGIAGDRGYRDIAKAIAAAGFRVLLPHYFDRTQACGLENDGGELDALGGEIERYGLWLEAIGGILKEESATGRPIGLVGYSLGGYLALTAAMVQRAVKGLVVCYAGVPTPFMGMAGSLPPTLILHGGLDQVIPVSESTALARLLHQHRVPHNVHIYPNAGHGFCGTDAEDALSRIVHFLTSMKS